MLISLHFKFEYNVLFYRFKEGLNTLKLAEAIQAQPAQFKGLFLENTQQLSAADLINLFQPVLSTAGSSRRQEENRVLCYWRDLLIDIEGTVIPALNWGLWHCFI